MQEQNKMLTNTEIRQLESKAIDKVEKGDKPYRKAYKKSFKQVTCYDCGDFQNLRLITSSESKSSFKRTTHKKNRNKLPLLSPDGSKVYMCPECIKKRAKSIK